MGTGSLMPKELFYNGQRIKGGIVGDLMVSPTIRKHCVKARFLHGREINSVPVPTIVWLFVSGLPGLVGLAKRK